VAREAPLLAGSHLAGLTGYAWLFAPLSEWWLRVHSDPMRTVGCCGLNFYGLDKPNLLCACGLEIGIGHGDCIGPHWYALHESVVREDAVEAVQAPALEGRLARARARVAAPINLAAYDPGGRGTNADDPPSWGRALHLAELEVACGGGIDAPVLVIASPQLPADARLVVPIPWCQLVRFLVLAERPWGETTEPLTWKSVSAEAQHVRLSRRKRKVLMTVWGPGRAEWAVTMNPLAWASAWARPHDGVAGESGDMSLVPCP